MNRNKRLAALAVVVLAAAGLTFAIVEAAKRKKNTRPPETVTKIQKRDGLPVVTARPVRGMLAALSQSRRIPVTVITGAMDSMLT